MTDSTSMSSGKAQWREHDVKRLKLSLRSEMLQTQVDSMRTLFNRGKGKMTDMTIWCGTKSWKAHSCILASRCDFFRVCIEGGFKESKMQAVWMDDDLPAALEIFLEFLYTLDAPSAVKYPYRVRDLLDICKIAEKYDQPFLLEQIFNVFDAQSRHELYPLGLEDLLVAYKDINKMGDSSWLTRIRGAVLACLLKPEKLKNLNAGSKKILLENAELGFSLIELLADKCEDQERRLARQSIPIEDDWIPEEAELTLMDP